MTSNRRTSWMAEVDQTKPRKGRAPSIPHLAPFELSSPQSKTSRSSSFPATSVFHEEPKFSLSGQNATIPESAVSPNDIGYPLMSIPSAPSAISKVPSTPIGPPGTRQARGSFGMSDLHNSLPALPPKKIDRSDVSDEELDFRSIRELYSPSSTPNPGNGLGMSHSVYCVVTFKANRAEVYVRDNVTQFCVDIRSGQDVIVEADRGQDIGQVQFTTTSLYKADRYARTCNLKHHRELVRSSFRFSHKWREIDIPHVPNPPNGHDASRRLKVIKRMANQTDLMSIFDKENMEARCKRICQDLVQRHRLDMEVLEAEWQADYQRLTFFYFSPNYVVFNNLVHDLFRIFKKRIWMSSVNAATAGRAGGLANYSPPKDQAFANRAPRFGIPSHDGSELSEHQAHAAAEVSKKAYDQVMASINSYNPSRFELTKPGASGSSGSMNGGAGAFQAAYMQAIIAASAASNNDEQFSPTSGADYSSQSFSQQFHNAQHGFDPAPRLHNQTHDHYLSNAMQGHGGFGGLQSTFNRPSQQKKQGLSGYY